MAELDLERYAAYLVCKERGHKASGVVLDSMPPWEVCEFCGTWFQWERRLIEGNVPTDPNPPSSGCIVKEL